MRTTLVILLLTCCHYISFAQGIPGREEETEEVKGFDRSKLFVAGNFGLGFGSTGTNIIISPQLGYRFNRLFAAGAGPNFQYYSYKDRYYSNSKESYGVAGFNIFGRIYPIDQVLLQLQPEMNYTWGKVKYYGPPEETLKLQSKFVPSLLAGAGGVIPTGPGGLVIMAQYDLLQNDRSPYGSKVFYTIGYNIGL